MSAHAMLGPSGSKRWLECPPSARAELSYPNTDSEASIEGTLAHDIGEVLIKERLGIITRQKAQFDFQALAAHRLYNLEMLEYAKGYRDFVLEIFSKALAIDQKAVIFVERRFELTRWVPESFGRTDITITAGYKLIVIDLKYGQGERVEAIGNTQTRLYALGALDEMRVQFPHISEVEMYIHQPRLKNFGVDRISAYELWQWAEEYLKPRAAKAFLGQGDFKAGDHCKFCRAKARCRELSEYARTPAGSKDFADPNTLTDEEIAEIGRTNPLLVSYSRDVAEYMLLKAIRENKQWPGFKKVEGRSNRTITDEKEAVRKLMAHGYKDVINIKIKGFGELEALVGATHLTEILGPLIQKPEGKPTLVISGDSRSSYHSADSDFQVIDPNTVKQAFK